MSKPSTPAANPAASSTRPGPPVTGAASGAADTDAPAATPERYEDALAELERLVQAMEGSQMPLDQLLDSYRRGAVLLGACRHRLQAVQDQVKLLEDGQLKDWAAE